MIKAVIFDCFGVLVGQGFWAVYRKAGGDPVADAEFIDHWINRANLGEVTQPEFRQAMADKIGISVDRYVSEYNKDEVPNPPIFEFIKQELKPKYKIGLLSNANVGVIPRRIPPDLLSLFDAVVVSGEVKLLKPDPAIYRLTAERLGVSPQEAVFTDDHDRYLPGATEVGMHTILYTGLDDFKRKLSEIERDLHKPR